MEEQVDLEKALAVAIKAAQSAGNIMLEFYQLRREDTAAKMMRLLKEGGSHTTGELAASPKPTPVDLLDIKTKSSSTDLVTHYDKLCDETIMKILQRFNAKVEDEKRNEPSEAFSFQFITEELTPDTPLTDEPTWIVDPIDGTMSFVHGGCDCCISIGLAIKKQTVLAVVYCPFLSIVQHSVEDLRSTSAVAGELYTAIRGKGTFLNGQPIRVSADTLPNTALVAFNYPMGARLSAAEIPSDSAQVGVLKRQKHRKVVEAAGHIREQLAMHPVQGIRSYGSCALILAQVAAGRIDLYMEPAGMVWDVCAGSLLITEAGGVVKNMWGGDFGLEGTTTIIAAANETLADYGIQLCTQVNYGDYWKK
ncbi:hypothetical protein ECC02_004762 [Trypanosoma cruzi]|uniref:Inositol-1-monophosphatase n=1 Tax=Trypanosoma cruzi TaxID=5693 RepID=A0A7J6Y6C6_TRYCR|nr:hypothetical protein ECC02_004762 [Trypanosoma cruzi]